MIGGLFEQYWKIKWLKYVNISINYKIQPNSTIIDLLLTYVKHKSLTIQRHLHLFNLLSCRHP